MTKDASGNRSPHVTRRKFLQLTAGAGAAVLAAACAAPTPAPAPAAAPTSAPAQAAAAPTAAPPTQPAPTAAPAAAQPVTITHWYWIDDPQNKTYGALIQDFEASHPTIKVQSELIGLNDLRNKLLTGLTAGELPDVSRMKDWWMAEFVQAGALEPLDGYIKTWQNNDVIANIWDLQRIKAGDPIYMLPWEAVYLYLYYRTDWFKEANLKAPETTDDFLAAAKALTTADRFGYGMRGASGGDQAWAMLTYPLGLRFVDKDGNIVLDNAAAVKANQWYLDLYLKEKVCPPTAPADGFAQIVGAFEGGKTAMTVHHVGSSQRLVKSLGADKFTAIPIPQGPQGRFSVAAVVYNSLFKTSKNKEAAFTFASWLAEKEANDKWASGTGVLPIVQSLQSAYASRDPYYKASIDSVPFAGMYPQLPTLGKWTSQIWPATMQQALNGQIDSQAMCKALADGLRG